MSVKYWYYTTIEGCPVCGRDTVYRERRPLPKPKKPEQWYEYIEHYDWCEQ